MSKDPYDEVQQEIQSSLQTASTLRSSYLRIRSMAREDSEELIWARNELKAMLAALEADLEDLEESVRIVEASGARMFDLEEEQVMERRRYVSHVRREIDNMRAEVESDTFTPRSRPLSRADLHTGMARIPSSASVGGRTDDPLSSAAAEEDDQAEWARQEQEMMIRQQDQTITTIAGTLSTLQEQAGLMGHEINEHNEMLVDLERNVDRTDSKLGDAMRRMRHFIRQTEETKSGWCIVILIIILMALLLAVILV